MDIEEEYIPKTSISLDGYAAPITPSDLNMKLMEEVQQLKIIKR